MFRLTYCIGILVAMAASGSASAEMRDITTIDKFCFVGGPEICERDLRHVEFKIDWPGKVVEFRGTRVGFGSTVYINEPPFGTLHYTEPTRLRASVDGLRLTFERTAATQSATLFVKDIVSYVLQFGQDGKCSSFKIVTTLLQPTSSDYRLLGVSCDGRIDVSQAVPPAANQTALDAATAKEACGMVAYFAVDARGDINKLPPSVDANKLPLWIAQCNANPDVEDCITTAVFIIQKLHKLPPGLLTCNCPRGQAPTGGGGECELADLAAGTGGTQVHSGQQTAPDARVAAAAAPACSGTSANAATRDLTLIGACTAAYCSPGTDANARANLRTIDNKLVELQVTTAQTRAAFEHFKRACRAVGGDMTKTGPAMDDFRQATFQLGLDRGKLKDEYDAIQNPPLEDVFANTSSAMARPPYQQPECMNNINRLTIDTLNAAQDLLQQAAIDCRPGGRTGPPRDIR